MALLLFHVVLKCGAQFDLGRLFIAHAEPSEDAVGLSHHLDYAVTKVSI